MKNNLNTNNAPVVRIIEFNPTAKKVVGLYSELGGKNKYLNDDCVCPTCGGVNLDVSDYIGYLQCNDCKISLNASEFYNDIKERNKVFLQIIDEVKSNVDNYAITQILQKELHKKFENQYYTAEFRHKHPKFLFYNTHYGLWLSFLKNTGNLELLDKAYKARQRSFMSAYLHREFMLFCRMGVLFDHEDKFKAKTISISKHTLLLKVRDLTRKVKELKQVLKDYGIY